MVWRKADQNVQVGQLPGTESIIQENLEWLIPERGISGMPFQRYLFANLSGKRGDVALDFELKARFVDSRRTEVPIWVRANPVKNRRLIQPFVI